MDKRHNQLNPMTLTFEQINTAIINHTSCCLKKVKDDLGQTVYSLRDDYDNQMGDHFEELDDVVDFVLNNEAVATELLTNSVIG